MRFIPDPPPPRQEGVSAGFTTLQCFPYWTLQMYTEHENIINNSQIVNKYCYIAKYSTNILKETQNQKTIMIKIYDIDKLDREILATLLKDAKTPYTEIAKQHIVSPGTIHVRMKRMERLGIVKGATLILDVTKIGYDLTAFVGIYLIKGSAYSEVIKEVDRIPEIVEAHYTTGEYSIFAKIVCKNTDHLREVINEKLQPVNGVSRTETMISLGESIKKQVPVF